MIESYLALSSTVQGTTAGVRFRTFFLCSLTGEYEFYFSCYKECEWFLKESENSGGTITSGNSSVGMTRVEYRK